MNRPVRAPQLSWWHRRVVTPLARQLTQGVTPARLALGRRLYPSNR